MRTLLLLTVLTACLASNVIDFSDWVEPEDSLGVITVEEHTAQIYQSKNIYLQCDDDGSETGQDFKYEMLSMKGDVDTTDMIPFYAELTDPITIGFETCTQILRMIGFEEGAVA